MLHKKCLWQTLPVFTTLALTFRKPVQKLDFGAAEIVVGDDALSCQSLDAKHTTHSSKKRHLLLFIGIKLILVGFILSPGVAFKAPMRKQADVAMDFPMCRDFYGFKCVLTDALLLDRRSIDISGAREKRRSLSL